METNRLSSRCDLRTSIQLRLIDFEITFEEIIFVFFFLLLQFYLERTPVDIASIV